MTCPWGSDPTVLCKSNRAKSGAEEAATEGPPWRDVRGATSLCPLTTHSARRGPCSRAAAAGEGPAAGGTQESKGRRLRQGWKAGLDPSDRSVWNRGLGLSRGVCSWGAPSRQSWDRIQPLLLVQAEQEEEASRGRGAGEACLRPSSSLAALNAGSLCFLLCFLLDLTWGFE